MHIRKEIPETPTTFLCTQAASDCLFIVKYYEINLSPPILLNEGIPKERNEILQQTTIRQVSRRETGLRVKYLEEVKVASCT